MPVRMSMRVFVIVCVRMHRMVMLVFVTMYMLVAMGMIMVMPMAMFVVMGMRVLVAVRMVVVVRVTMKRHIDAFLLLTANPHIHVRAVNTAFGDSSFFYAHIRDIKRI